jgi:hypothetical protein
MIDFNSASPQREFTPEERELIASFDEFEPANDNDDEHVAGNGNGDPGPASDLDDNKPDQAETTPPSPIKAYIKAHLYRLFSPDFVKDYPDARIEIAWFNPATAAGPNKAQTFSAFDLEQAADFAEETNNRGCNVYVGAMLRNAECSGRASKEDVVAGSRAWAEFDGAGDEKRVDDLLRDNSIDPAEIVQTGSTPHRRFHVYVKLSGTITPERLEAANTALRDWLGGDDVQDMSRVMRLAGTVNYPVPKKIERGYVPEQVRLRVHWDSPAYSVEQLVGLTGKTSDPLDFNNTSKPPRTDDELETLLEASKVKNWHNNVRDAIATMIGRGWSDSAVRMVCRPYCQDGYGDKDLDDFINRGRGKWNKPDPEQAGHANSGTAVVGTGQQVELLGWDAGKNWRVPSPRPWLLGTSFCCGFGSSLFGEGGAGKSALRYAQAISLTTTRKLTGEHVFKRCRVLLLSLEDGKDELQRRLVAACLHHEVDPSELEGWLFVDALSRKDGKLMVRDRWGNPMVGLLAARLERTIVERKIDLVILDPFIKSHGLGENSNDDIDEVAQVVSDICIEHEIAFDVPHHMSKGPADPGNASRGRGASALKDALRLVRTITTMSQEEAKALGVDETLRRSLIRIDDAKLNLVPPSEAKWFRLVGVNIGNATELYPSGDNIQTVEMWMPPALFAGLSAPVINRILDEIKGGLPDGNRYSNTKNVAEERAAWAVVMKHCDGMKKGPATRVVKTWLDAELLIEKGYTNPITRKEVSGLWVDDLKRPA